MKRHLPLFFVATLLASTAGTPLQAVPSRVDAVETVAQEVRLSALIPWSKAWEARDAEAFGKLLADKPALPALTGRAAQRRELDGIKEAAWSDAAPAALSRKDAVAAVKAYLDAFASVEDVSFDIADVDPSKGIVSLRYDLRGRLKDGSRRNDRGSLELTVQRSGSAWKIARIQDSGMETLTSAKPVFEDVTAKSGLDKTPLHARKEAIRRGGYALAVSDYDGDALPDVYVGGYGESRLFRNNGDGTFRDATREAGLAPDTLGKAALIADLDGDAKPDLTVQRFVHENEKELVFYRNIGGGRFEPADAAIKKTQKHDRAMSMAAADFDGDGRLDLYMAYPGVRDFTDERLDTAGGISHQTVYLNKGGFKFEEMPGAASPQVFTELVRPHSALATDIDGDARSDIVVVDDRGNSSRLYLNQGGKKFSAVEVQAGLDNSGWGMMAVAGDFDNDGREDLYFTNIVVDAGDRLVRQMEKGGLKADEKQYPELARLRKMLQGNRLYRALGGGAFREVTERAGVGWAGQAPAGAEWVDYNNDGLLDIYVANGLWSADPETEYSSRFIRDLIDSERPADGEFDDLERANYVMKRLQESGESFAGYQRNRLFRNDGDGSFTEVGYLTGADRVEDGYVVAVADYDRDGRADLILRNTDPPSLERPYSPVAVLRNTGGNANKSLAVTVLRKDGSVGFNCRVTAKVGGRTLTREIRAVTGAVQSETVAHLGIGAAEKVDSLEVMWPSGQVDRFENVSAGRITVREGQKGKAQLTALPAGGAGPGQ